MAPPFPPIRFPSGTRATVKPFTSLATVAADTKALLCAPRVALSGGTTYGALLPLWVALAPDCTHTMFFPVDERVVPFEHADSNWRQACERLLVPLGRAADRAHFATSLAAYTTILHRALGAAPRFDTVFLGMGDDGHTASLFPGTRALEDDTSLVMETVSPKPPHRRITLGPAPLGHARHLIAVVAGSDKRNATDRLLAADMALPLVSVLARHPSPVVYIDETLLSPRG